MTERMLDQEEQAAGVASLTKRLRAIAGPETPLRSYVADLMREAADALEAVERERDEWRRVAHEYARRKGAMRAALLEAEHELSWLTREFPRRQGGVRVLNRVRNALAVRTPEGGTDGE